MFLRDNINLENIENIVVFDIDQTLGSSVLHSFTELTVKASSLRDELKKRGFLKAKAQDIKAISELSVKLFAELLQCPNTKAICISSWGSYKDKEKALQEIEDVLSVYADFPDDWLIGSCGGSGGDRHETVKRMFDSINYKNKYVVIDDSGFEFKDQNNVVTVDGLIGFSIYDFVQCCKILNITQLKNKKLEYYLKK